MSSYVAIFAYISDADGNVKDEDNDLIGIVVSNNHHDGASATAEGLIDTFFDDLAVGTNIKFELFNLNYSGNSQESDEVICNNIRDNMHGLLESQELVYVNNEDFMATVAEDNTPQ
jgi:hypothetical protein